MKNGQTTGTVLADIVVISLCVRFSIFFFILFKSTLLLPSLQTPYFL